MVEIEQYFKDQGKRIQLILYINDQKFFNAQISIAPIRIFLHCSDENISGYFKTSDLQNFHKKYRFFQFTFMKFE